MGGRPLQPIPRAVLFDLDDTLCDYSSARRERLRFAFSSAVPTPDSPEKTELIRRMIDASIGMHPYAADHFPELFAVFGAGSHVSALQAAHWFRRNRFYTLEMFPAAVEVLRKSRFVIDSPDFRRIGIITNGPSDVQRAKIELLGVAPLVDFILISEEFGAAKPERAIFEAALGQTGVAAGEVVFIGDSAEHDMAGAISIGMQTIWINRTRSPWPEFGPGPDRSVRDISEIPRLISSK